MSLCLFGPFFTFFCYVCIPAVYAYVRLRSELCMSFLLRQRRGVKTYFTFSVSFFTLLQCCGVGSCMHLFLSCLALWLHLDWNVSHCLCPNRPPIFLSLRADWPRSPLAHGCRSTHNSPVHSACSSQRLSQNFSVSVPTLIFTGTQRQERKKRRFLKCKGSRW